MSACQYYASARCRHLRLHFPNAWDEAIKLKTIDPRIPISWVDLIGDAVRTEKRMSTTKMSSYGDEWSDCSLSTWQAGHCALQPCRRLPAHHLYLWFPPGVIIRLATMEYGDPEYGNGDGSLLLTKPTKFGANPKN